MTRRLGKYEILEEIGRGGFATVYRARDPDLDRDVAIKVLDPSLMRDPSLVERFRREARAAARLHHPGIVGIHDISDAEGVLAIVMDLLPGPSLADIAEKEAPLPMERAVELLRPLAEALDYAHAQGLIHRDVKPSNAILSTQGQPVLTDFGLVKAADESGSSAVSLTLSQAGMTLGTPAYLAPEQADSEAKAPVDRRADLYSLGVVAYELLTGRVPFEGATPLAVAVAHLVKAPPPPRELNPALPEGVEAVLLKMLAKKPEERFESARAFVEALTAATVQPETAPTAVLPSPVPTALSSVSERAVAPPLVTASLQPPAMPSPAVRQRRALPPLFWLLTGGAAVLLAVLVIALVVRPGRGGNQEIETPTTAPSVVASAATTTVVPTLTPAPTATTPTAATPAPTATTQATATPPAPVDILKAASTAMEEVDSVHIDMTMQMTMTTQGMTLQIPMTLAGDVQNPDCFKGTMTMEMMDQSVKADMIVISPTTYISESTTGKWQTTTAQEAGLPFDPSNVAGITPEDTEGLTFVGEETVAGRAAYHLTGTAKSAPLGLQESLGTSGDVNLKADYWIDKENSYMLKSTVSGDIEITGDVAATVNLSMVMTFSDFNKPVNIEAPEVSQ